MWCVRSENMLDNFVNWEMELETCENLMALLEDEWGCMCFLVRSENMLGSSVNWELNWELGETSLEMGMGDG